jgi:hypothetical protein
MCTDFNQKGKMIGIEALKSDRAYYSLLNDEVKLFIETIGSEIAAGDQDRRTNYLAVGASGCLERLSSCFLQLYRLAMHEKEIKEQAPQQPGEMVGLRKVEALFDFEALLFHSRSALDRISFFIAKQVYRQDCDKFTKLGRVLSNFEKKDTKAKRLIEIISEASKIFEGVVINSLSGQKSLRSHLIHKSTAAENSTVSFTLYCLPNQRRLAFDCILNGYPLFGTAKRLCEGLSFLVLNALSIYVGGNKILPIENCKMAWENNMVDFQEFQTNDENGKRFSLWATSPSGIWIKSVVLTSMIMSRTY